MTYHGPIKAASSDDEMLSVFSARQDGVRGMEASRLDLRSAMRAADESLKQLKVFAGERCEADREFSALLERHRRDREMLFSAMRRVEEMRKALQCAPSP